MIEFANGLDRLFQLLIVVQPAANLGDALATHAELPRASTSIGDRQNKHPVPFAHFGQSLVCRTVRSSSEPRSNSPVTGSLPTSFSRARRDRSRIIHKNESERSRPCQFQICPILQFSMP